MAGQGSSDHQPRTVMLFEACMGLWGDAAHSYRPFCMGAAAIRLH